LCVCHPQSQGVLLTQFGTCPEAADSESQIRCYHISTLVSKDQSQPICTHPWNDIFGIVHVAACPEILFEAVSICKSEGHVLCICHPHSQGVFLTHFATIFLHSFPEINLSPYAHVLLTQFGSCLEAADSESHIRRHHISTLVSRDQSHPICKHAWNDIFGIVHVAICPEISFEAVSICKSEGTFCVYAIHTRRACYLLILVAA